MNEFEEYLSQSNESWNSVAHYDKHTDTWIDEASEPYGHSGHADVHTDEDH